MAITLLPRSDQPRLRVVGDINARLVIPAAPPESFDDGQLIHTYYIALSDGTLIRARFDDDPHFDVVTEGASTVAIDHATKTLTVDWEIEWISLSSSFAAAAMA